MVEKLATPPSFFKHFNHTQFTKYLFMRNYSYLRKEKFISFEGLCIYGILVYVKIEIKFKVQGKSFMKQKNEEKKNLLS